MGGGAVGTLFTPAPWRLITDTALWSENWPGIPRPARGEVTARYTNCALCPAGCAVRARCVNGQPVSLAGVAAHPLSHGALCAFGLTGHHLPYHPQRLKQGAPEEAAAAATGAIAKRAPSESVAVLDLCPGRAASSTHRRAMAAVKNGLYLAPPIPAAVDLSKARIVLSLGVPLLDGWGTPGNVHANRGHFRLIQAEPWESRTAALADEWLPIRPGSESALALALKDPNAVPAAAQATGLTEKRIADLANDLRDSGLILGGTDDRVLSSVASVPDNSIRVLLIDESVPGAHIPWSVIEKKLAPDNPVVIAFAWSREGYTRHAQFALPTAAYPELTTDIPPAIDSPTDTFRISASLIAPPPGMVDPSAFIAKLAGIDAGNALQERADAIHKAARGTVFTPADGKSTPVKDMQPDAFWKSLNEGATWFGEEGALLARIRGDAEFLKVVPQEVPPRRGARDPRGPVSASENFPLVVAFSESRALPLSSPLMSKLYQDSDLRLAPNTGALHPDTARACGVQGASRAILQTEYGACPIALVSDPDLPPGMLEVAPGPGVFDICGANTRAKVVAA
jgi:hypothetical protein